VDAYGEPDTALALVAGVKQVGSALNDEAFSPFSKPEYYAVMVGGLEP
jgi:hypothetical protein